MLIARYLRYLRASSAHVSRTPSAAIPMLQLMSWWRSRWSMEAASWPSCSSALYPECQCTRCLGWDALQEVCIPQSARPTITTRMMMVVSMTL